MASLINKKTREEEKKNKKKEEDCLFQANRYFNFLISLCLFTHAKLKFWVIHWKCLPHLEEGVFIYFLEFPLWPLHFHDLTLLWLNDTFFALLLFTLCVMQRSQSRRREHIMPTYFSFPVPKFSLRRVWCKEWAVGDLLWKFHQVPALSSSVPTPPPPSDTYKDTLPGL